MRCVCIEHHSPRRVERPYSIVSRVCAHAGALKGEQGSGGKHGRMNAWQCSSTVDEDAAGEVKPAARGTSTCSRRVMALLLVERFSIELAPTALLKAGSGVARLLPVLPAGTRVYLPSLPGDPPDAIDSRALRRYDGSVHIPAQRVAFSRRSSSS